MNKLNFTDTVTDTVMKMAEGNIGAVVFLTELLQDNVMARMFEIIFPLDNIGIYGSNLYILWNDCCQKDVKKLEQVMQLFFHGKISKAFLINAVSGTRGENIDLSGYEEEPK